MADTVKLYSLDKFWTAFGLMLSYLFQPNSKPIVGADLAQKMIWATFITSYWLSCLWTASRAKMGARPGALGLTFSPAHHRRSR